MDRQQMENNYVPSRDDIISSANNEKVNNLGIPKTNRILLVDDERDITTIIRKGLQQFGFQVDAFNNPLESLLSFKTNTYDVALLDIRMPQMNGFALCKKLKEMDSKMIVCFMTSFEIYETEFKKMFPSYDVKYFIRKPIKVSALAEQLRKMLRQITS